MQLNSYYGLAENDYLYAKDTMYYGERAGNYNMIVSGLSHAGLMYLKAAAAKLCFPDEDIYSLLHGGNLRTMYGKIIQKFKLGVSIKDCTLLDNFNYNTRYPGTNFIEATKADAEESLRIVEIIREDVSIILAVNNKKDESL